MDQKIKTVDHEFRNAGLDVSIEIRKGVWIITNKKLHLVDGEKKPAVAMFSYLGEDESTLKTFAQCAVSSMVDLIGEAA